MLTLTKYINLLILLYLFSVEPKNSIPARITNNDLNIEGAAKKTLYVPCAAQGFPVPNYKWYKGASKKKVEVLESDRIKMLSGILKIVKPSIKDSNIYTCVAKNDVGEQKISTKVTVRGTKWTLDSQLCDELERLTFLMHGYPRLSSVDAVRAAILKKKVGKGDHIAPTSKVDLSKLPPCRRSLLPHMKRVNYHVAQWKRCDVRKPQYPDPTTHGWKLDNQGLLEPVSHKKEDIPHVRYISIIIYKSYLSIFSDALSVYIEPQKLVVDSGKQAIFKCFSSGNPQISLIWLKDGKQISSKSKRHKMPFVTVLIISSINRSDEGMYQCMVGNDKDSAQGTAQLILGDVSPVITQSFKEQTLKPKSRFSLRCAASGNPRPNIRWMLDGELIQNVQRRVSYTHDILIDGTVVSDLKVENAQIQDGGYYTCYVQNKAGGNEYSARINVYGEPTVRRMTNMSIVAGQDLLLNCFVYGYPISKISWKKDDMELLNSSRNVMYRNGTLVILDTDPIRDEGKYTCRAEGKQNAFSEKSIWVKLIVKPVLQQMSNTMVKEQARASLVCSLSEGDQPITFTWLKDKDPLSPSLGITETKLSAMSVLNIPRVHSVHVGNYTCVASNPGGQSNKTAMVSVLVVPSWRQKLKDSIGVVGGNLTLICLAFGSPPPTFTWYSQNETTKSWIKLKSGENLKIFDNGTMIFIDIQKKDEGIYI
ncbi:Down syndrome cell adhesion molecule-like protein Dscam2 [Nymphon striatum]|nr:Down syndrome cell adhesion molecule-like protein Dscam2 [Nymphon striatum]